MNDERRITNAEYMINLLTDLLNDNEIEFKRVNIDDMWSSGEAMIYYDVNCPYLSGDPRCECKNNKITEEATREQCSECKTKWLLSEVDD